MFPFIPEIVPSIVQALVVTLAFVLVLAPVMRKFPVPFYLLFLAAAFAQLMSSSLRYIPWLYTAAYYLGSCYVGVALYLLVMFAGALPRKWWVTKRLMSVRTEMSIIGGFIILSHVIQVISFLVMSFTPVWSRIWGSAAPVMFAAAAVVGIPLTICFFVPWFTSFRTIRGAMQHSTWKKIQKLAYPFMALLVAQGFLLALGHGMYYAANGSDYSSYVTTAVTYAIIGAAYLALKLMRCKSDAALKASAAQTAAERAVEVENETKDAAARADERVEVEDAAAQVAAEAETKASSAQVAVARVPAEVEAASDVESEAKA
jgi:DMSO/TMAO reductase YedYZ heme-binding membrane subunit